MIERGTPSAAERYSPQRRTAVVFSGTGTAGVYHAGVLRALHEAGVKLDVVAGRGIGAIGALFAAVDGGQRLWDEKGYWSHAAVRRFYGWRASIRFVAAILLLSVAIVVLPLAAVAVGAIVFPIDFFLKIVGLATGQGLVGAYLGVADRLFAPTALPTWLPRLVLLVLGSGVLALGVSAFVGRDARRLRGSGWWRLLRPPLSPDAAVAHTWTALWDLMRGAAQLTSPAPRELVRRYAEMLSENIGQPGFRELLISVHDVDAHRDLLFALVAPGRRTSLVRRPTNEEADARHAEVLDLAGAARDHLADALAGSLAVPIVTDFHRIHFAAESYWRGESHRIADRPGAVLRLLGELADLDVEQIILVSAAPETPGPHALTPSRLDGRARLGEYLQSSEAAMIRDVSHAALAGGPSIFLIRPAHNPVGPFDFAGGYDDRSDRMRPLAELAHDGYADAYHQFIEPVLGASGEAVGVTG
jgi:hypothetical protein